MYNKTSKQLAVEFATAHRSLRKQYVVGKKASQEVAVAATPKKLGIVKGTVLLTVLTCTIVASALFAVNANIPEYDGTVEVPIVWSTDISTIEDAVRAANPTATGKHIADAVEEFIHINEVNSHTIKAGTYKVPVIK